MTTVSLRKVDAYISATVENIVVNPNAYVYDLVYTNGLINNPIIEPKDIEVCNTPILKKQTVHRKQLLFCCAKEVQSNHHIMQKLLKQLGFQKNLNNLKYF